MFLHSWLSFFRHMSNIRKKFRIIVGGLVWAGVAVLLVALWFTLTPREYTTLQLTESSPSSYYVTGPSSTSRSAGSLSPHEPNAAQSRKGRRPVPCGLDLPGPCIPLAHIDFGDPVPDEEIIAVLDKYDVQPHTFFMRTSGGFSGSHQVYDEDVVGLATKEIVAQARNQVIHTFAPSSVGGNNARLKIFLQMHTLDALRDNPDLEDYARALLHTREAFALSSDAADRGASLIHALEVEGTEEQFAMLQEDESLCVFVFGNTNPEDKGPCVEASSSASGPYVSPDVEAMSIEEVYQTIVDLAEPAIDAPEEWNLFRVGP